jgi:hypothetical protein
MKSSPILFILTVVGCRANEASQRDVAAEPLKAQAAVAVVCQWLRVAPTLHKGDSLHLYADSSAQGFIPWPPNRLARISRWKIRYMSKEPVGTRQDWRQGYTDGGDAACMRDGEPGCVSLPTLCLGAEAEYSCEAFALTPDSLLLSTGAQYIRLTPIITTADSQRLPNKALQQTPRTR